MILHYKRAIQDILNNQFLNIVTVVTIALSILIVSAFYLFFANLTDVMTAWKKGIRVIAYLKPGLDQDRIAAMEKQILSFYGVKDVRFVSKDGALERLKEQMHRQSAILEDLRDNPLPDAFEIRMAPAAQSQAKTESLAEQLEALEGVDDVEYGQKWLVRFTHIFDLFRFLGYALGCLFFMAAVFIVANTIRLVLYSRRDEVDIMRLVGATDNFIKAPFYIEGLIQGACGGLLGLTGLFVTFLWVSSSVEQGFSVRLFKIRFLSFDMLLLIMICSMFVGWLGSYLSLRQFLKD